MDDQSFMHQALDLAMKAFNEGEVPVGALVVYEGRILSSGYNQVEKKQDATAHAELIAIKEAQCQIKNWRLTDCTVYTTLEPCLMCYGALILSRVKKIVYAAPDLRHGACGGCYHLHEKPHPIHQPEIYGGVLMEASRQLLKDFFKKVRYEHGNS